MHPADDPATPGEAASVPGPLSFQDVYRQHAPYVLRVLRRLGVRPDDLEDVGQNVFVVVHRKLAGFNHRSSVRTWLYGIAVRCASEYRRRAHVRLESPCDAMDQRAAEPQGDARPAPGQVRALLDAILDGLDHDKRVVFVLFELEEMPMMEIASVVKCPLQTAYSRLYAAREQVAAAVKRQRAKEGAE